MREGFRSSQTIPTMRSPQSAAMRGCAASSAGMLVAPGRQKPSTSAIEVMVEAVPMVLQVPWLRHIAASRSTQSWAVIFPARSSS